MKHAGIYIIFNIANKKYYVGSAVNCERRKCQHWSALRLGKHCNPHLQAAFNKYGEDYFTFVVAEPVKDIDTLIAREQGWMNGLDATNPKCGYNVASAEVGMRGRSHNETSKQKMRESQRRRYAANPESAETRAKKSDGQKKRYADPEERRKRSESARKVGADPDVKRKLSDAAKGRVASQQTREKISAAQTGKTYSEETLRNMSEGQKKRFADNPQSAETRAQISDSMKEMWAANPEARAKVSREHTGRKHSDETRAKMSENKKQYYAAKRAAEQN